MSVKLNGVEYTLSPFDDTVSVMKRYALKQDGSLPEYFSIQGDKDLVEGGKYKVSDVRTELSKIKPSDISSEVADDILKKYPNLKKRDIGSIWIHARGIKKDEMTFDSELKKIDRTVYTTRPIALKQIYERYPEEVSKKRESLREEMDLLEGYAEELKRAKGVDLEPFDLEEVTNTSKLDLPNGESLINIFDSMDVSREVPFLFLFFNGKPYFKVYKHLIPPQEWIENLPTNVDGLYIKLLNAKYSKLDSKQVKISNLFANAVWDNNNNILITHDITTNITQEAIYQRIFDSLGKRIEFKVVDTKQISIRGTFTVKDFDLNRAIFSDLVENNNLFSYFFYFNERLKTVIQKERFLIYYSPNQNEEGALTITVTPQTVEGENRIDVRISRAQDVSQAKNFMKIFHKILGIYLERREEVVKIYTKILPNFKTLAQISIKASRKKREKKTGKRADALYDLHPDVFMRMYSAQCQKPKQPYHISEEEAKKFPEHKVMNWPLGGKDWYACEPREEGDTGNYIWPGLQANKNLPNGLAEIPCCFEKDQYTKGASRLRRYIQSGGKEVEKTTKESLPSDLGYIKKAGKEVAVGRYGEAPFYVEKMVEMFGFPRVNHNKAMISPVLRYGIVDASDSFLHCMVRAFDDNYTFMSPEARDDSVYKVREKLADLEDQIGKQELYDFTKEEIRSYILNPSTYISPDIYVDMVEDLFSCNVFLFVEDDEYPNGNVLFPRSSQAYLSRTIDTSKPSVMILKSNSSASVDYPYQCSVLAFIESKEDRALDVNFVLKKHPLVEKLGKLYCDANVVYTMLHEEGVVELDRYNPLKN